MTAEQYQSYSLMQIVSPLAVSSNIIQKTAIYCWHHRVRQYHFTSLSKELRPIRPQLYKIKLKDKMTNTLIHYSHSLKQWVYEAWIPPNSTTAWDVYLNGCIICHSWQTPVYNCSYLKISHFAWGNVFSLQLQLPSIFSPLHTPLRLLMEKKKST